MQNATTENQGTLQFCRQLPWKEHLLGKFVAGALLQVHHGDERCSKCLAKISLCLVLGQRQKLWMPLRAGGRTSARLRRCATFIMQLPAQFSTDSALASSHFLLQGKLQIAAGHASCLQWAVSNQSEATSP